MATKLKLSSWGNSKAIRIPVSILDKLDIKSNNGNEALVASVKNNKLIIEKANKKSKIDLLFEGYDGPLERKMVDFGEDVGAELVE